MSLLVNCEPSNIVTYCTPCEIDGAIRKSGIPLVALIDSSVALTDITDATEWAAAHALGLIKVLPQGRATLTSPEQGTQPVIACRPDLVVSEQRTLEYMTNLFDNENYLDFDLEYTLNQFGNSMTVVYADCNDILYYSRLWATGDNPGHSNISVNAYRQDDDAIQMLTVNIQINTYKEGFKGLPLTTALKSAIFGCDGSSS